VNLFKNLRAKASLRIASVSLLLAVSTGVLAGGALAVGGPYDFTTQATDASDGAQGLIAGALTAWQGAWPVILGLIAIVMLAFWILNRAKKGASSAR
jgi:hypothetical protein